MKTKFIWRFWSIVTLVVAIFYIASCDEKDNPVPQTPPEENTGDITIDIPNLGGEGSGTSSDPAVVPQGETFNLEINQKSSYKDTDGSVYTCEPKAIINLSTESDTIYVKDLASLTEIIGNPVVKTSKSGNNPVQHQTTQTFNIGGQNVNFELSYEVYNYVNKASQTIEMPYVKVNNANLGKASSETSRSQAPAISLKKIALSRSDDEDDMTAFEMTVSFSVPIESVNTSSDQSQDINFDVKYTGIVVEEAPKLKSVFYRQSYDWEEPHDNIEINYGFYVYRDRIYTDGTTYTDTICSPRFFPGFAIGGGYGDCLLNDERITEINDSITIDTSSQLVSEKYQDTDQVIIHGTVGVDDLSKFETRNVYREIADEVVIVGEQTLDDYEYWCGCLAENCEEPIEASTQNFQTTDLPNGWYMCRIVCYEQSNLRKGFYHWNDDFPDSYYVAFRWGCDFLFCTQLLVIDNKAITFDEWLPTGGPCDAYCEEYPAGYYKAKPGTTVLRDYFYNEATFLERKFFFEVETLLYERNPN